MSFSKTIGQKQDYVWHLGTDQDSLQGIQAMQVNFNSSSFPQNIEQRTFVVGFDHNNQAICDEDGELLFYTNGCAILNRNHEIMPNGDTLNHSDFKEITNWDNCDYGYPGLQNILIVDDPGDSLGYYIFHKTIYFHETYNATATDLRVSYVDMSLDAGLGDVVYFDSTLVSEVTPHSYLSAMKHSNKKDWWILQPV